ncbi:MAG: PDZ domain-containing protein [Gemmataceae bacterium]
MILPRWTLKQTLYTLLLLCASGSLAWGQAVAPPENDPTLRDPFEEARQRMREMEERLNQFLRDRFGMEGFPFEGDLFPPMRPLPFPRLGPLPQPRTSPRTNTLEEPRLGARLAVPNATLADQLDLPRESGLIIEELSPNGPAAKAGLRAHDILLEVAGQSVPRSLDAFRKHLTTLQSGVSHDVVVMRKGVKQTIKGLQLADTPAPADRAEPNLFRWDFPELRLPAIGAAGLNGKTNVFRFSRQNEHFRAEIRNDGVTYFVEGKQTADGPVLDKLRIDRDGKSQSYERLQDVPEADRSRIEQLLRSIR